MISPQKGNLTLQKPPFTSSTKNSRSNNNEGNLLQEKSFYVDHAFHNGHRHHRDNNTLHPKLSDGSAPLRVYIYLASTNAGQPLRSPHRRSQLGFLFHSLYVLGHSRHGVLRPSFLWPRLFFVHLMKVII